MTNTFFHENHHVGKSGYDDGYDDVYSDGEPDWDRYDTDDEYARGADDALDEYEEYGKDW